MKWMIVIALSIVVLGGSYFFNFETLEYVAPEPQTIEKIVEVDTLIKRIKEAQDAKADVIRSTGEQARVDAETRMLEAIELEVRQGYGKELDATELELKKKQTSY